MQVKTIDADIMFDLLQQVVNGHEDFVYPRGKYPYRSDDYGITCLYRRADNDTAPACIVGHVLDKLGLLSLAEENTGAWQLLADINGLSDSGVYFDDEARLMADRAQRDQDAGTSWGMTLVNIEYWRARTNKRNGK